MLLLAVSVLLVATEPTAGSKPPTAVRFQCNSKVPQLKVSLNDVELTLDAVGVHFSQKPLLLDDAPLSVDASVAGERATLVAHRKPEPGLSRLAAGSNTPALLVQADVWSLCMTGDGDAWALVSRDGAVRFVLASTASPSIRFFDLGELLVESLSSSPDVSVSQAQRALTLLTQLGWPEAASFADLLLRHPRADLRALLAKDLAMRDDATGRAALWLLAHDKELKVREQALEAVRDRCMTQRVPACLDLYAMFIDDPSQEQSWLARDFLLVERPQIALKNASTAYKLDAVSLLTKEGLRLGPQAIKAAADLLANDPDVAVRRAARGLMGQFE